MARWPKWTIVAVALLAAGAGAAQQAPPAADVAVEDCRGFPSWRPSLADNRDIATIPVPESFRRLFESPDFCIRATMDPAQLVDWHLWVGNVQTAAPALAYLEAGHRRQLAAPDRLERELRRAWRAAHPDMRRAQALPPTPQVTDSPRYHFMRGSRPIRRLRALLGDLDTYILIADHYVRAAEEFESATLLDRAEPALRTAVAGHGILEPIWDQPPAPAVFYEASLETYRTEDLQMRVAVLRARLTRSPADLARAQAVVQSFERPAYTRAAELAFTGGNRFCDIDDSWEPAGEVRDACARDQDLQDRVTNHWISRAMLELDGVSEELPGTQLAMRLLELEGVGRNTTRCCRRSSVEDRFRLLVARADHHRRQFSAHLAPADRVRRIGAWIDALDDLERAEELLRPHQEPARLRRIALSWLSLWAEADGLDLAGEYVMFGASPDRERFAAYLRHMLAGLDAIAVGAVPERD